MAALLASGTIHVDVVAATLALLVAWVLAWRARRARPRTGETLAAAGAAAAVLFALNGPLHDLGERSLFSAHMLQHLLLTLVVPPLVLAATPAFMADAVLAGVARLPGGLPAARTLTRPVPALVVYAVALVVWHLPGPWGLALDVHAWHIVEHVTLIAAATVAWWPVLARSERLPALPYGAQVLYLFAFGVPMTVVAALITAADEPLYTFYTAAPRITALSVLEDQRLGGVLMWVPAGLVPLVAFTAVFFRWAAAEAEEI